MSGHLSMTWEASVGVESEVAQLRRGYPNALSALLMWYQRLAAPSRSSDLALPLSSVGVLRDERPKRRRS
jgi:hypothetical protein